LISLTAIISVTTGKIIPSILPATFWPAFSPNIPNKINPTMAENIKSKIYSPDSSHAIFSIFPVMNTISITILKINIPKINGDSKTAIITSAIGDILKKIIAKPPRMEIKE